MTSNAIHGVSFRLAGLSAGKYSLFCIQQMYFVMSDGPCWETIADLESFPFMSPIRVCTSVFKFTWSQTPGWSGLCWWGFLQTGQIQTRPLQMEDANKKCGNIRRDSYSTESACRRGVAWWRNSEPCLNRHCVATQQVESVYRTFELCVSTSRQFTVRDLSCRIAPHLV